MTPREKMLASVQFLAEIEEKAETLLAQDPPRLLREAIEDVLRTTRIYIGMVERAVAQVTGEPQR